MNVSYPIDLSNYRRQFYGEVEMIMDKFENNVVHPLVDQILKVTNPEYFDGEDVDEEYYDTWADAHMNLVDQLGPTIFGKTLYKEYRHKLNGEGI